MHACERRPILRVQNLRTHFFTRQGVVKSVDGVDLTLHAGEILGLVGESGSGKSITGFSLMQLIDPPGRVVDGRMELDGEDLRAATPARLRSLRGREMAMIFQDPMMTLNPVLRVETQMVETVRAHRSASRAQALEISRQALLQVGIAAPAERLRAYPHQLSGGMRQRVAIAMALLHAPKLLIADEPTTALDVTIQGQILHEVQKLCRQNGTALIWITHDLAVVSSLADRIAVMYAGRVVESAATADLVQRPLHPYTLGLMRSIPTPETRGQALQPIAGMAPAPLDLPAGCAFRKRCPRADAACAQTPETTAPRPGHQVRCWHAGAAA